MWNELSSDCPEAKVYDTQVDYARMFLERLEARMDLSAFPDGIEYVFAQVAKLSLREQTDIRFNAYRATAEKNKCFKKFGGLLPATTLSYLSGAHKASWAKLWQDVKINPQKLYIIFQDEAHYGAKDDSTASVLVADNIQHFPNAVHVCITATPYAIIPPSNAKDGSNNVVFWSAPPTYYDYARLKKGNHVDVVQNCCVKEGSKCSRKRERDVLMARYEAQLLLPSTTTTTTAAAGTFSLRAAIDAGRKIIIRARNKQDDDLEDSELEERFTELLQKCGFTDKVAFLVDPTRDPEGLDYSFSCANVAVVVIKQVMQMGDTFPRDSDNNPIVAIYDESLHYHGTAYTSGVTHYDKIHQEFGRAFGYYPNDDCVTRLVVTAEIDAVYTPPICAESYHDRVASGEIFSNRTGITAISGFVESPEKHSEVMRKLGITKSDSENYRHKRLFVLWAQPQSGKTGAVLWLMKLIAERFGYINNNSTNASTSMMQAGKVGDGSPVPTPSSKKAVSDGSSTTRCAATTASGSQCKRDHNVGSEYCFQHKSTSTKQAPSSTEVQPTSSSSAAAASSTPADVELPLKQQQQKVQQNTTLFVYDATIQEGVDILQDMEMFEDKRMYVALGSDHNNPVFPGEDLVTLRLSSSVEEEDLTTKKKDDGKKAGGILGPAGAVRMYVVRPYYTQYRLDSCKAVEWSEKCTQCAKLLPLSNEGDVFTDADFIPSILKTHRHPTLSSGLKEENLIGLTPSSDGIVWMQLDRVEYVSNHSGAPTASDTRNIHRLQGLLKNAGGTIDLTVDGE